jgi:uncharacterized protein DUF2846/thiamine pyrophosphate-dependent enzyme
VGYVTKTVADQFADSLAAAGVKRVYGIVGDSLNGLSDALRHRGKNGRVHAWHEKAAAFALAFLLLACQADPPGTPFAQAAARIPPVEPGQARLYFYRAYEPYESAAEPRIYLNGARVAVSIPGSVSYRDVAPGEDRITVDSCGIYPNQFKTLDLRPGDTVYIKIESLRSWGGESEDRSCNTFVVTPIAEVQAREQLISGAYIYVPGRDARDISANR